MSLPHHKVRRLVTRSLSLMERVVGWSGEGEVLSSDMESFRDGMRRIVGCGNLAMLRGNAGRMSRSWKYCLKRVDGYVRELAEALIAVEPDRRDAIEAGQRAALSASDCVRGYLARYEVGKLEPPIVADQRVMEAVA